MSQQANTLNSTGATQVRLVFNPGVEGMQKLNIMSLNSTFFHIF